MLFTCLGLLGLVSFMLARRTKEIGIRKVLGASVPRVLWTLGKEYFVLVAIANVIVLPLVYYGWHRVMQLGLLYITETGIGSYFFAVAVSLSSAIIAVISQTVRKAVANPVESLRYE